MDKKRLKPLSDPAAGTPAATQSVREEKSYNELFCELVEKVQSLTQEELDEFICLAWQALNRPLE